MKLQLQKIIYFIIADTKYLSSVQSLLVCDRNQVSVLEPQTKVQFQSVSKPNYLFSKTQKSCYPCFFSLTNYISITGSKYATMKTIKDAVCPRSLAPFYIVSYYIIWINNSWTYSENPQSPLCLIMYCFKIPWGGGQGDLLQLSREVHDGQLPP